MIKKRIIFALARLGVVLGLTAVTIVSSGSHCLFHSDPNVASADVDFLVTKDYGDCTGGRLNPLEIVNDIYEWGLIVQVRNHENGTGSGYAYKEYCFWNPQLFPASCFNLNGSQIQRGTRFSRLKIQVPTVDKFSIRVALVSACDGCQSGDSRYSVLYRWGSPVIDYATATDWMNRVVVNALQLQLYTNTFGLRVPELKPCPSLNLPFNTCPNCLPFQF